MPDGLGPRVSVRWVCESEPVDRPCPVCADDDPKVPVVEAGDPPCTFVRCSRCKCLIALEDPVHQRGWLMDEAEQYYVEQGAGIDVMAELIDRCAGLEVHSYLEVGCGYGFSLDYARSTYGWDVRGIDPSPLAASGATALHLPIDDMYVDAATDLGRKYDLIFASEVIEHFPDPAELVRFVEKHLSSEGVLALTTPNRAAVQPSREDAAVYQVLSPGYHAVIFDQHALTALLVKSGLSQVQADTSRDTLMIIASRTGAVLSRIGSPYSGNRSTLRRYLARRAKTATGALQRGLLYRHFRLCVQQGEWRRARSSFERLRRAYATIGIDPGNPEACTEALRSRLSAKTGVTPCNLAGVLYYEGMLDLQTGREARSARFFAHAHIAGRALQDQFHADGFPDGETEDLIRQARDHEVLALLSISAARATDLAKKIAEEREISMLTGDAGLVGAFITLVAAGHYDHAAVLSHKVRDLLSASETEALHVNRLVALAYHAGMLALNHEADPAGGAEMFRRAHDAALDVLTGGPGDRTEAVMLVWDARLHEAIALKKQGRESDCARAVQELLKGRPNVVPVGDDVATRAHELMRR